MGLSGRLMVLVLAAVVLLAAAPGAVAQRRPAPVPYLVTFAARECPTYTDITANRARNDIQESLEDLGADTSYSARQPIDPAIEAADQPNCTPLPAWTFTLGKGYKSRAVTGPWGALSIVTGPYSTSIVTEPSVPLLDSAGAPTGDQIEGAVTIELTPEQLERATRPNTLWTQGGTVADPILDQLYPGQYGFGALRCAIDNLNGDNVEWISYPAGAEHVFCYAYYVRPPPTSGTIIIRKQVQGVEGTAEETFTFDGNLSFNSGGLFDVRVKGDSGQAPPFYRAAGETWTARELVPAGWRLNDINCTQTGLSGVTTDLGAATVNIALAAADTVTCTFVNDLRPPAGQLFIRKVTRGGTGAFNFEIFPLDGGGDTLEALARTETEDLPVDAEPSPLEVSPGRYRVEERLPRSRRGKWRLERASCNAQRKKSKRLATFTLGVTVVVEDQRGVTCLFENEFVPSGAIAIDKVTLGGTGRAGFTIQPLDDPETSFEKSATTKQEGVPVRARGDSTRNIPLGDYVIQESEPAPESGRVWTLEQVLCDNTVRPSEEGRVVVRLTRADPRVRCVFFNSLRKPPGPGPDPQPPGPDPAGPESDLVVTKIADRQVAGAGERISYRVSVENRGPGPAEDVTVVEQPGRGERVVAATGRRQCNEVEILRRVIVCRVGDLAAGQQVTFRVVARLSDNAPREVDNTVAANSATPERSVRNNIAVAGVRVRRLVCSPGGRRVVRGNRARAAC